MANAHMERIKELYMWWNGWVFSFEKAPKPANTDDEESSGMDEAVVCLDNFEQERRWQEEVLIESFDSLSVAEPSASGSGVPQPASVMVSTFSPGPSDTHSVDTTKSDVLQPIEEELEIRSQNGGKGKEKAVDITEADMQVKKAVGRGKQRGRPKKTAI
jgi:hypothetical protein